jgi:hypothetical protein
MQEWPACDAWWQLEQFSSELPYCVSEQEEAWQSQQESGIPCLSAFRHERSLCSARTTCVPAPVAQLSQDKATGQNLDKPSANAVFSATMAV